MVGGALFALIEQSLAPAVLQPAAERLVDALCDMMNRHIAIAPLIGAALDVSELLVFSLIIFASCASARFRLVCGACHQALKRLCERMPESMSRLAHKWVLPVFPLVLSPLE